MGREVKKSEKAKIAARNKGRGRSYEKRVQERFGGYKQGLYGGEDVATEIFSIEAKTRKKFVGQGFMEQAVANCPKDKVPLVIIHVVSQRMFNDLVMMRLGDFEDWYGNLNINRKEE